MDRFKLKSGLTFTPKDCRYVVLDTATQSTYRVGETEYKILKQFAELTNPEEVSLRLRVEEGVSVPYDSLYRFIQRAMALDLLRIESDAKWRRFLPGGAFEYRVKLFDPERPLSALAAIVRKLRPAFALSPAAALAVAGILIVASNFSELWVFRGLSIPRYAVLVGVLVYLSSIGHEMTHGLVARYYGFEVTEIGVHLHYFLPSFYCRIFRSGEAGRRQIVKVLLAGCGFDLVLVGVLAITWRLSPGAVGLRQALAVAISMLLAKVVVIQMNPLFPFSDGFRIAGLFWTGKRGTLHE
jgi:hypothetical protein